MNPLLKNAPVLTPDMEDSYIAKHKAGDKDAAGVIIHANAAYIQNVIRKMKPPAYIDVDEVFSDIVLDLLSCLGSYNRTLSSLQTFLYLVTTRSASKAIQKYTSNVEPLCPSKLLAPEKDTFDVVEVIQGLIASLPDEAITESGRKLVSRMLRGFDVVDIAAQMGWGVAETQQKVDEMRLYIAWLMVQGGHSAEPWISDETLSSMAKQHERECEGWF